MGNLARSMLYIYQQQMIGTLPGCDGYRLPIKPRGAIMNSYQFFLKHAGYSYDPKTQTPMQGRVQGARRLAAAERKARDVGYSFQWSADPSCLSSDWIADDEDGGRNCDPWHTWQCALRGTGATFQGSCGASLHGIDFGRDGEPWGNPYRRVVEAELALEALDREGVQS
jgi:hypothetical protein